MLIGIGSASRVGKDTSADALCRVLGYTKIAFADKLKQLAMLADPIVTPAARVTNIDAGKGRLDWAVRSCGGWEAAKDTVTEVRPFLERLGNGAREVFGPDFWIERALTGVYGEDKVVVADVRKLNEAEHIRDCGGKLIRVNRPGYDARPFERELEGFEFDATITNSGSIQDLEELIVGTVEGWVGGKVHPSTTRHD